MRSGFESPIAVLIALLFLLAAVSAPAALLLTRVGWTPDNMPRAFPVGPQKSLATGNGTPVITDGAYGSNDTTGDEEENKSIIPGLERDKMWIFAALALGLFLMLMLTAAKLLYDRNRRKVAIPPPRDPFERELGIYMTYDEKTILSHKVERQSERIDRLMKNRMGDYRQFMKDHQRKKGK